MPSGLKPQYDGYPLTPALRLGLVTVLSELGFSPDSACTELVEAPDIQSACTEPVEVSDNKLVQIIYCQSLRLCCVMIYKKLKNIWFICGICVRNTINVYVRTEVSRQILSLPGFPQ